MAVFTAYNRWLDDDWGYDRDGRILTGPMISLMDPVAAEAEVDRVLEVGTRLVIMRAGPVASPHGRPLSPADPRSRPHLGQARRGGCDRGDPCRRRRVHEVPDRLGREREYTGMKTTPLTEVLAVGTERPIFDMMAAMICHGLFDRHPTLRVATLELGSAWVPELHRRLRVTYGKTPQLFGRDPIESFREHVWVAPFYEDSITSAARPPRRRPHPARVRLAASGGPRLAPLVDRRLRRPRRGGHAQGPAGEPAGADRLLTPRRARDLVRRRTSWWRRVRRAPPAGARTSTPLRCARTGRCSDPSDRGRCRRSRRSSTVRWRDRHRRGRSDAWR